MESILNVHVLFFFKKKENYHLRRCVKTYIIHHILSLINDISQLNDD
jgi:hypothetical protein